MTKSRAEILAEEYQKLHTARRWAEAFKNKQIDVDFIDSPAKTAYLAGMKAMYLELEKYAQEIKDAEFPATREQQIIVDKITRDLGKLMGQDG